MHPRSVLAGIGLAALVAGGALLASDGSSPEDAPPRPRRTAAVRIGAGAKAILIEAEIAATPAERERGLSGRRSVPQGSGVLFMWPDAARRSFWMKDTLVPLDLVFVLEGRVAEVARLVPCRADPCPLTTSRDAVHFAVELPAGTLARAGLGAGALVEILGTLPDPL